MDDQNKNLILATALSFIVILIWFVFFPPEDQAPAPDVPVATQPAPGQTAEIPGVALTPPAADGPATTLPADQQTAEEANAPRIAIDTPAVSGSISMLGGRIDQLSLKRYHETLAEDSPIVSLLAPVGSPHAYYTLFGWAPGGTLDFADVPGANTEWQQTSGDALAPDAPITLSWDNGKGLTFQREISIDDDYMFTVTQSVNNATDTAIRLAPYGIVARHGKPDVVGFYILHEGVVRMSDGKLEEMKYKDMPDLDTLPREGAPAEVIDVAHDGWIGFTDKYWMTTLIPEPGAGFTSVVKYVPGADIYQTEARNAAIEVAPGTSASNTTRVFSGAKEWETIRAYEKRDGVQKFVDSIDWGWFFFLTKPIFFLLHWLHSFIGNMGWSVIALTFLLKAFLFPLAYKSYASMARMKELQPEMEEMKEKAGGDRQKMQQGMMALYKKNKVNPASGCLPILLQVPIFFSLYKVIFVTLELRHAPWIGWIRDLSAPDPSSILNLFGLLPYATPDPSSIFHLLSLGILPILLGCSMWLQQRLNPAPTDATQAMIFAWMPWVFMFMLGQFASGLVLYWITNNTITFIQQYAIMRHQGYKPDVFGNIRSSVRRKKAKEAADTAKKPVKK